MDTYNVGAEHIPVLSVEGEQGQRTDHSQYVGEAIGVNCNSLFHQNGAPDVDGLFVEELDDICTSKKNKDQRLELNENFQQALEVSKIRVCGIPQVGESQVACRRAFNIR